MLHTVKRRGTMETYRNEEQMKCLAKSEGCSVFRMENATGEGTIAMYELFRVSCSGSMIFIWIILIRNLCRRSMFFVSIIAGRGGCSMWRMRMPTPMWRQEI